MDAKQLMWPVLVQIGLTLFLYIRLVAVKLRAVRVDKVDRNETAKDQDLWPDYVRQVNNSIRNQFETPVLFYVVTMILLSQGKVDIVALVLAWAFVAFRVAHAFVHLTSNNVKLRTPTFSLAVLALVCLAVYAVMLLMQ